MRGGRDGLGWAWGGAGAVEVEEEREEGRHERVEDVEGWKGRDCGSVEPQRQ